MNNSDTTAADLPPELGQIAAEAAALEQPPAAAGQAVDNIAPPADFYVDAKGLTDIAAESLSAFYPSTEKVLNADKREKFAAALAPVLEKYGLSLAVIFGRWGAEINLLFVTAQFAVPLARAIADDRAAAKAAKDGQPAPAKSGEPAAMAPVTDRTDPNSLHLKA